MKASGSLYVSGRFFRTSYKCTLNCNFFRPSLKILLRSDVMLCSQAFNMADKMADVQIALTSTFLLS